MTVAAAITTFNRLESLKRCIEHVRAQTQPPDEIIVVNDHSTDGTDAWLATQPDVVAVNQPENLGCANSFHTVLRVAYERGHDYAWTMDDDVFAEPGALAAIVAAAEGLKAKGIRVGGLAPHQSNWDRDGIERLPLALPSTLYHALRYRYMSPEIPIEPGRTEPIEIASYSFCGNLFTREAMAAAGFPDPTFFYYGEDYDYAYRLMRLGFRNYLAPASVIFHAGSGAGADVGGMPKDAWRNYYMYRNQWTMVRRYRRLIGPGKALACHARILMGVTRRLWWNLRDGNLRGCRMSLYGLWHGIRGKNGKTVSPPGSTPGRVESARRLFRRGPTAAGGGLPATERPPR